MVDLQFIIITGLSGAGKTQATRCLEDLGFFCVDNLPPALIPQFADLCRRSGGKIRKVAVVVDIRGGDFFADLFDSLKILPEEMGIEYQILFLEASSKTLVRRFKEARRKHPLSPQRSIISGIKEETEKLKDLRSKSNYIIDTSDLNPWQLKRKLSSLFSQGTEDEMNINIISFGYKYGVPIDADWVFDVRFLPNPNYVPELQNSNGLDKRVIKFVLNSEVTKQFLDKTIGLVKFLIPYSIEEGKSYLTIAIGCTGGRHRSVVIANHLGKILKKDGMLLSVQHRDIRKK